MNLIVSANPGDNVMTKNDSKKAIFFNLQFYIRKCLLEGYDITVSEIAEEYANKPLYFNFIVEHYALIWDLIATERYRLISPS